MKMRPKFAAGTFQLSFGVGCGVLVSGGLRRRWAAMLMGSKYDGRRLLPAYPAGMLLHRQAHRSGEDEQGQPDAEEPVKQRTVHMQKQRYNSGAKCKVQTASGEGAKFRPHPLASRRLMRGSLREAEGMRQLTFCQNYNCAMKTSTRKPS